MGAIEGRLYLSFEYVDMDLKKFMDICDGKMCPKRVKVKLISVLFVSLLLCVNVFNLFIQSYACQLLRGINYCHQRGIMHRYAIPSSRVILFPYISSMVLYSDLKPQNILVSRTSSTLKIADFGLARQLIPPIKTLTHEVVTLWYRSPEILLGQSAYSLPIDIWSVGAIIAEMSNKKILFRGLSEISQLFKIFK